MYRMVSYAYTPFQWVYDAGYVCSTGNLNLKQLELKEGILVSTMHLMCIDHCEHIATSNIHKHK